jgi:hypothetical protein
VIGFKIGTAGEEFWRIAGWPTVDWYQQRDYSDAEIRFQEVSNSSLPETGLRGRHEGEVALADARRRNSFTIDQ